MEDKKFCRKARRFCQPLNMAHYRLRHVSKKTKDAAVTIAAFPTAAVAFVQCYPFSGPGDLLFCAIGAFLLGFACTYAYRLLFHAATFLMSLPFLIPALVYRVCDDKINHVSRKRGYSSGNAKAGMDTGPEAAVGIRYFIEREKNIQINHAELLD